MVFGLAAGVALLLLVRLVPSLLGLRVFVGTDAFSLFVPWSPRGPREPMISTIYVTDQLDFFFPGLHEIAERLREGDIAGWSSLASGGSALLSTPTFGVISPGRWLFLVLPTWLAPAWSKLAEMAFAAVFSYLLVRRLNGSRIAAGLAAFVYPMTGFMIAWTNWPQAGVASGIPMLFWAVERFVQEKRAAAAVPVAIAVAVLLFGGFPAVAGLTLYFGGVYALVRVLSSNWMSIRRCVAFLATLAVAVGVGVGLTAFQLLPFKNQLLSDVDLSYRDAGVYATSDPRFLASATFPLSFSGNNLWVGASPMDVDIYIGGVVLLLAVFGATFALAGRIRGSAGVYFVCAAIVTVVLAHATGPWSAFLDHLPVFHANPIGRVRSQLGVPVAVLAGFGVDWLRRRSPGRGWLRATPRWGAYTVTLAVAVTFGLALVARWLEGNTGSGLSDTVNVDVVVTLAPLGVILMLVLIGLRHPLTRAVAVAVALFCVGVQALAATSFFWPAGDRDDFYAVTPGIQLLEAGQGNARIATLGFAMRPNATAYYGLNTLNGHAFTPQPMKQMIQAIDPNAFVGPTYSLLTAPVTQLVDDPGLSRMSVRYLVAEVDAVIPGSKGAPAGIVGQTDQLPAASGALALAPGQTYTATIPGGAMRGVTLPLTTTAKATWITVRILRPDGSEVLRNTRSIGAGVFAVPVPLAGETLSEGSLDGPLMVSVTVDQPATGVATSGGHVQLATIRPFPSDNSVQMEAVDGGMVIWLRRDYSPRIHWAGTSIAIADDAARLKTVSEAPFTRGVVVLDGTNTPPAKDGADAPLSVEEDSGDRIRVHVDPASPGYVVVTDNVQQDFDATLDGASAPIIAADYAGGAVYVPTGSHDIELRYNPEGRTLGALVSVLCAILLLFAGGSPWGYRRFVVGRRPAAPGRAKVEGSPTQVDELTRKPAGQEQLVPPTEPRASTEASAGLVPDQHRGGDQMHPPPPSRS